MNYTALDIAHKIIAETDTEGGEAISNLKLQKLLYYVQGFFLAAFEEALFSDEIVAWQYGPVVPDVYFHFKEFGSNSIRLDSEILPVSFDDPSTSDFFDEILREYGRFSAIGLMELTHQEPPWKKTFNEDPRGVISHDLMKVYFKTQLVDE